MLSATESATCSLVITPATSPAWHSARPRTTTAMMALRRHMRRITSKAVSSSPTTVKLRLATSPRLNPVWALFQPSAKARVDADHAVDMTFVGDHDVAQAPGVLGLTQIVIETRFRRQNLDVGVHHLARGADQKHVGVARFWNGAAATHQLQGVDGLAREHSACADAHGNGNDHRHHDAVVESHLEDHRDSGHHRAGSTTHHRPHADHREGGDAELKRQRWRSAAPRSRRQGSHP